MRFPALVALALLAAGCGGSAATGTSYTPTNPTIPDTSTPVATTSVSLINTSFTPPNIQVAGGAVVTFTNNDAFNHNVTFTNTTIGGTGNFTTGAKTLTMPATAGAYPYRCTIHSSMTGVVTVK